MHLSDFALAKKRDDEQEYTLHLFEKCNLKCSFCWQDHNALKGVDTILEKMVPIKEFLDQETKPKVSFNVMGGEIFDDSIFNRKLFDNYIDLSLEIVNYAKSKNIEARINFVSNLVTEQPQKVAELLDTLTSLGIKNTLVTSYDSRGRFNKAQFTLFKQNVEILRERIASVSMLLTKPVIRQIMNEGDEYFKYLYKEGFEIYFDYYTPTIENDQTQTTDQMQTVMAPSDLDLLKVFYYLVDHYPNVQPIKAWIENTTNTASCRRSKLVLADGTKCLCGNLQLTEEKNIRFYNATIKKDDNGEIEDNFLKRWDCLSCEYFERCQLGCFMQHDYAARGQMVECPFKLTFDKIVHGVEVDLTQIKTYFGKRQTTV